MSIWPSEEYPPLKPGEVSVTERQFSEIAALAARLEAEVISDAEFSNAAEQICPELKRGQLNMLVVRYPRARNFRICC